MLVNSSDLCATPHLNKVVHDEKPEELAAIKRTDFKLVDSSFYALKANAITLDKIAKKGKPLYNKTYQHINTTSHQPSDSTFKDPGLKKAKDLVDEERQWLVTYFIFLGITALLILASAGTISLGVFSLITETQQIVIILISLLAFITSLIISYRKITANKDW